MRNQLTVCGVLVLCASLLVSGCYVQENTPTESKANPEKALHDNIQLGFGYIALGNTQRAKAPLARAMEINPKSPEANAAIAYLYQLEDEPALAEQHYKKALDYDSKFTTGRNNYGMFLYSQKRYDEALTQLKIAADDVLSENRASVFNNIGLVYLKMDKMAEAEAAFNKSKVLDGDNPATFIEIAQMNFNNKAYEQAYDAYKSYVKLKPQQDPRGLWIGVRLANVMGKKDEEIRYGEALTSRYPTSEEYFAYSKWLGR